jgi:hypothetical protein
MPVPLDRVEIFKFASVVVEFIVASLPLFPFVSQAIIVVAADPVVLHHKAQSANATVKKKPTLFISPPFAFSSCLLSKRRVMFPSTAHELLRIGTRERARRITLRTVVRGFPLFVSVLAKGRLRSA